MMMTSVLSKCSSAAPSFEVRALLLLGSEIARVASSRADCVVLTSSHNNESDSSSRSSSGALATAFLDFLCFVDFFLCFLCFFLLSRFVVVVVVLTSSSLLASESNERRRRRLLSRLPFAELGDLDLDRWRLAATTGDLLLDRDRVTWASAVDGGGVHRGRCCPSTSSSSSRDDDGLRDCDDRRRLQSSSRRSRDADRLLGLRLLSRDFVLLLLL